MENILSVVQERDRAVGELEAGTSPHPKETWRYDELGRAVRTIEEEHYLPRKRRLAGLDWSVPYLRAEREQRIEAQRRARKARAKRQEEDDREQMLFRLEDEPVAAQKSEKLEAVQVQAASDTKVSN